MYRPTTNDLKTVEDLERVFRIVFDNLYSTPSEISRAIAASETKIPALIKANAELIQQLLQANGTAPLNLTALPGFPAAGGLVIEDTHANRLTNYSPASYSIGTLFVESDRRVVYAVALVTGVNTWVWVGGRMVDAIANRPADLGANDVGFQFYSNDVAQRTIYTWDGAAWVTTGGALWQAITADSVTAAQWKQVGGAVVLNLDTTNKRFGINVVAPDEDLHVLGDIAFHGAGGANRARIVSTAPTGVRVFTLPDANSNSVIPDTGAANNFLTAISAGGVISKAQPSTANISDIASGVYTPALTNVTNLDGSTAFQCQYVRVGSVVTVSGKVSVDPTAAGSTKLGIALPIASNLGAAEDCAGTAFSSTIAGQGAAILGDATNDRAQMEWIAVDTTNQPMYFVFVYRII